MPISEPNSPASVAADAPVTTAADALAAATQSLRDRLATDSDGLAAIRSAIAASQAADAVLPTVVDAARARGRTWQEVGDTLGISRQAAFQRFGHPTDPRTGRPMDKTPLPDADRRARHVFDWMHEGRWHDVYEAFDATMQEKLPEDQLGSVWAQVVATVGEFDHAGTPASHRAADYTVVDVPLTFEAAEMVGRVTYDDSSKIAGFFVLTPEQAESF